MTISKGILLFRPRRTWLAWEDALLAEMYPHVETDVCAWFLDRGIPAVRNRAKLLSLHKTRDMIVDTARERSARPGHGGAATRFQPGQVSHNAGKKGLRYPGSEKGWFKKGHQRSDTAPVGAERIDKKDGYVLVKIADKGEYALPWRLKHRMVWEAANGPVPKGMTLVFMDGNRQNCALENLTLITRRELMLRNTVHNLPKPVAEAVQLLGALRRKINARERKQNQSDSGSARTPVRHAARPEGQEQSDGA